MQGHVLSWVYILHDATTPYERVYFGEHRGSASVGFR